LEHTQTILENLELGELWDAYGLVGDVVVSAAFKIMQQVNISRAAIYREFPSGKYSRVTLA